MKPKTHVYHTLSDGVNRIKKHVEPCEMVLLCDRKGTVKMSHPILGTLNACERCASRYA
jgi:hypothetical protein